MKPGKPLAFGRIQRMPHLGLPGNPVSSLVSFDLLARPAILIMQGRTRLHRPQIEAIFDDELRARTIAATICGSSLSKRDGDYHARLTGEQGSGILTSMARANGLAVMPKMPPQSDAARRVPVIMLDWPEE